MHFDKTYPEKLSTIFPGGKIPGSDRAVCSGSFLRMMGEAGIFHSDKSDLELTARMSWAYTQWNRAERPILRIDEDLCQVLMDTDLPEELEVLPDVPWDGFYLVLPPIFDLIDDRTGAHKAEGLYLCKDLMRQDKEATTVVEGFLVVAVGDDKRASPNSLDRDDTIHYFGLVANKPIREVIRGYGHGTVEASRIVLNLLLLWGSQNNPVTMSKMTPSQPKSPKKLKRLERRGKSLQKYFQLSLKEGFLSDAVDESEKKEWDGEMHVTLVRGHYSYYWVLDPEGAATLGERSSKTGKTLYKVRRFIAPHRAWRRGPDPARNIYSVK
jgi:hypothetical protein